MIEQRQDPWSELWTALIPLGLGLALLALAVTLPVQHHDNHTPVSYCSGCNMITHLPPVPPWVQQTLAVIGGLSTVVGFVKGFLETIKVGLDVLDRIRQRRPAPAKKKKTKKGR